MTKQQTIDKIAPVLLAAGFPRATLSLFVTQVGLESAWLTNPGSKYNNVSGIKMAHAPSNVQFQRSIGAVPHASQSPEGDHYAEYPSLTAWAKDYHRILSSGSKPINATTAADFVKRILANNYATGTGRANYSKGFPPTHATISSLMVGKVYNAASPFLGLPPLPFITPLYNSVKNALTSLFKG